MDRCTACNYGESRGRDSRRPLSRAFCRSRSRFRNIASILFPNVATTAMRRAIWARAALKFTDGVTFLSQLLLSCRRLPPPVPARIVASTFPKISSFPGTVVATCGLGLAESPETGMCEIQFRHHQAPVRIFLWLHEHVKGRPAEPPK